VTGTPLVDQIRRRLVEAGYRDLRTPLRVAGVDFEFTAAMQGSQGRGLDLVVLIDTTTGAHGDREGDRIRQRIEGLSRALDVTGSRLVVTAILAGAAPAGNVDALSEICRVLRVEPFEHGRDASGTTAPEQIADRIRILLPLSIPDADSAGDAGSALEQLRRALPKGGDARVVDAVLEASREGAAAVTTAVAGVLDGELDRASDANLAPGDGE